MSFRKKSDIKLIETYFDQHYEKLCQVAFQYVKNTQEAEDIVQDFFYLLWDKRIIEKIEGSFDHYATKSIRNNCLNILKKKQLPVQDISPNLIGGFCDDQNDLDIRIAYEERLKNIENSIQYLPVRQREVLKMKVWEGLKYQEISERLDVSINTIKTHIKLAYKNLRKLNL